MDVHDRSATGACVTKVAFASPTYGPIDPQCARSQRIAIMHAAHNGVTWTGDASPDRAGFAASRNATVESIVALTDPPDYIFWCDSDMVIPSHAVTSLINTQQDFVTGMYFQRRAPYMPLAYIFDPKGGADHCGTFRQMVEWPDNVVAPIDGCGFGCVLTSIRLLKSIDPPWFEWKKFGEDFTFCLNARKVGYQLFVHTGVQCGHLPDPVAITVDDFRREYAKLPAGQLVAP
jgi:hypothetical protein